MSLIIEARVGKKYAIYLPKAIVNALDLKEGQRILLKLAGSSVILESLQDPVQLALKGKKFASMTPENIEAISLEEQSKSTESAP